MATLLSNVVIIGQKDLERTLNRIGTKGGSSVSRAAMTAAMGPLKKQIRIGVNAMRVFAGKTKRGKVKFTNPTALKRAARATIGSSVKKQSGTYVAKAGFGVGKQTKAQKGRSSGRSYLGKAGVLKGVGISKTNIHWATLGTKQRHTQGGHSTGKMPDFLSGIIPRAAMAAKSAMVQAAAAKAKIALKKEAQKRR